MSVKYLVFQIYMPSYGQNGIYKTILFFVCYHMTFHPNDGQSNNLWMIFLPSEHWFLQEKLNGNLSFES